MRLPIALLTAAGLLQAAPLAAQGPASATEPAPAPTAEHFARAHRVLRSTPLIDGHNDLPWEIRRNDAGPRDVHAYDLTKRTPGHTDLARLDSGRVGAQFWSVYVPGDVRDSGYARMQLEEIDIARQIIAKYPRFELAWSAADVRRAFKRRRIASLIGLEGGHVIENSVALLRTYRDLGARYMTLTHNVTLDWADAASDSARHGGLTAFGEEVVREMNRLGMLVDLSHVSPATMSDALDVSAAPVIFSHSSARAITDVPRNVPDSILARLPKNGGVVMVTFVPGFINSVPDTRATLAQVADHIEHVRRVAGVDHVGIGSDFDGIDETPVGLSSVADFPALFAELARRGWSDGELRKLAGENVLRVMERAEQVASRLQRTTQPSTARLP